MVLSFRLGRTESGYRRKESSEHRHPLRFAWPCRLQPARPSHASILPNAGVFVEGNRPQQIPITCQPFLVATLLRANEQRVWLGFARFARTLLAAIASKGQAAGRDFARLLAEVLPLRMTLLVCSQGNQQSQSGCGGVMVRMIDLLMLSLRSGRRL